MDRAELLNDAEEAMRLVLDGRQSVIWTAIPGIVQSVDLASMTCEVQPAIQGSIQDEDGAVQSVNLPLLVDVPIVFPSGGGFLLTYPLAAGDEVLIVFSSRCIDAWWQSSGIQRPAEARMHDLSDGFAIPGPRSQPNKKTIASSGMQLRNNAGTVYFQLGSSGKFKMINSTKNLKGVLDGMIDLTTMLNTALTTFAAALAGGTPAIAAGSALNAALTTLAPLIAAYKTTDIEVLLE